MKELKVKAVDENLSLVLGTTESFLQGYCSEETMNEILISIDELFINVAHYAYGNEVGDICLRLEWEKEPTSLKITLIDQGVAFNPFEKEDPDIDLTLEERKIGGLGIFMVKDYMNQVDYEYKDGSNIVTLIKNLK